MKFFDRIKKEMSEGIVKAIFEYHNYRVIDTGIEKVIREVSCLPAELYLSLGFPDVMRNLPDFVVMNQQQSFKALVDVKYRNGWDNLLLFDPKVRDQLKFYRNVTLIVVNGAPPEPTTVDGTHRASGAYIRCVLLKHENGKDYVKWRGNHHDWVELEERNVTNFKWFSTQSLFEVLRIFRRVTVME